MWFAVCAYLSFGGLFYAWLLGTAEKGAPQLLVLRGVTDEAESPEQLSKAA